MVFTRDNELLRGEEVPFRKKGVGSRLNKVMDVGAKWRSSLFLEGSLFPDLYRRGELPLGSVTLLTRSAGVGLGLSLSCRRGALPLFRCAESIWIRDLGMLGLPWREISRLWTSWRGGSTRREKPPGGEVGGDAPFSPFCLKIRLSPFHSGRDPPVSGGVLSSRFKEGPSLQGRGKGKYLSSDRHFSFAKLGSLPHREVIHEIKSVHIVGVLGLEKTIVLERRR